jgi:hypothetical protein
MIVSSPFTAGGGEMPSGRMMFPLANPQLAEMGSRELTSVFDPQGIGHRRQKRRMPHDWAPALGERQLNQTFIFNSAWEAQRGDVRKQESEDSLQEELQ